ncbi:Rha family transcriptional regulator [Paenibacillus periandrae]|uniref:Rha family transcriptional regulator n=1 Tax=Paenibacillus periandrae TaxID=1761741 RepID=UPI001F09689C
MVSSSIENVEDFNRLNFEPIEYFDNIGRKYPMYEMTRDGFMMLDMGFTGNLVCCDILIYANTN